MVLAGGGRGAGSFQSLLCRKIFSIARASSINATIFIVPPHVGHVSGSTSYTAFISAANASTRLSTGVIRHFRRKAVRDHGRQFIFRHNCRSPVGVRLELHIAERLEVPPCAWRAERADAGS